MFTTVGIDSACRMSLYSSLIKFRIHSDLNLFQRLFTLLMSMIVLLSAGSVAGEIPFISGQFESGHMAHQHKVVHCDTLAVKQASQLNECTAMTSNPLECCHSSCIMHIAIMSDVNLLAPQLEQLTGYPPFKPSQTLFFHSSLFRPPIA